MRSTKYKHLATVVPDGPPKIEVPPELFPLPATVMYSAVRGSGKTTALTSMLRKYKDAGCMHRCFLICPTYPSNAFLFEGLVDKDDVFEDATQASLDTIVARTEEEAEEWERYKKMREIWKRYHDAEHRYIEGQAEEIDEQLMLEAIDAGVADIQEFPPYKYGADCQHPCMWAVVDDCQSSQIFNPSTRQKNNLANLVIRHRHIGGNRFGLSMVISMQNWKTTVGSLSRALRANMTCLALYGIKDKKLLDDIYTEVAREIDQATFFNAFQYATAGEKYNHLFIEFTPKLRMRKNFDEILAENFVSNNTNDGGVSDGTDGGAEGLDSSDGE